MCSNDSIYLYTRCYQEPGQGYLYHLFPDLPSSTHWNKRDAHPRTRQYKNHNKGSSMDTCWDRVGLRGTNSVIVFCCQYFISLFTFAETCIMIQFCWEVSPGHLFYNLFILLIHYNRNFFIIQDCWFFYSHGPNPIIACRCYEH